MRVPSHEQVLDLRQVLQSKVSPIQKGHKEEKKCVLNMQSRTLKHVDHLAHNSHVDIVLPSAQVEYKEASSSQMLRCWVSSKLQTSLV